MDLSKEVKAKTKQLLKLKAEYSAMVQEVDKEFALKKQIINEMTIHFPLTLAQQCLSLLKKDPPDTKNISILLNQLKEHEMESDYSYEYDENEEEENFNNDNKMNFISSISQTGESPINETGSGSSSDSLDGSFHLDDEKFFGQFNQNSDPLLDD